MEIHSILLRKGFFPKELPPAFTTDDFGVNVDDVLAEWETSGLFKKNTKALGKLPGGKIRRGSYTYSLTPADPEPISKPKRGYERRYLHVVHPLPHALLCREIGDNWKQVQKWLSRQTYSEDDIRIDAQHERGIKGINFPLHEEKKRYLEATSDWIIKTDITQFYPSIYTHSISWAAYGKESVKRNLNAYKGSLADRIDTLVRSCNRNQTVGIPIGPETSRIIAEVISSRIDYDFTDAASIEAPANVDRLQDDWTIGAKNLEEAERILAIISNIYRTFGLDINGSKTSIDRIVAERKSAWISEMGAFLSHRHGPLRAKRLREFLDLTLTLQSQNSSGEVVSYALSVVDNLYVEPSDIPSMESFLLKAAIVAPVSLDRICRIILDLQHRTGKMSAKRISSRFAHLAEAAVSKGHVFEVIWLLYTLRGLKHPVEVKSLCDASGELPSATVALILMDMKSKGLGLGHLPMSAWQDQITEESIKSDWTWLMAYEGIRHGWMKDTHGLMKKPLFKPLIDRNIEFYDPKRNMPTSASIAKKRRGLRLRDIQEVRTLLRNIRGGHTWDY